MTAAQGVPRVGGFWEGYQPRRGSYDELVDADGALRAQWQRFSAALEQLGKGELERRWERAQRLMRDTAIADRSERDPGEAQRPWPLDPLPLLVGAEESRRLGVALAQRARLLNLILSDVYGPQRIVREGWLPPEIIFGDPAFLRPCHGQVLPEGRWLHLYAADVARGPDGQMVIVADRTDAPSGAGFSLENRLVVSRMLPNVFRECRIERLAPFFISVRQMLWRIAPRARDNPRVVLMTRGQTSRAYLEDAYLARYLGCMLAEGDDLTVRDSRVMLKTLAGLLPVDVIWRRQRDDACDPLELRSDGRGGVVGLLQAVRDGNVAVANAVGTALAESPTLLPFLPGLCRKLLGEELAMPSLTSWWCGDAAARAQVLERLDQLVVRERGDRQPTWQPRYGWALSRKELEELRAAIEARPEAFVAQERTHAACAPVLTPTGLRAAHAALRCYLVATEDDYEMMPGGLTRTSTSGEPLNLIGPARHSGGRSKDTWVLSDGVVQATSLLPRPGQAPKLTRSGAELPSRVADNLFWLGRQIERAEGLARLLRTLLTRMTGEASARSLAELPALLRALVRQELLTIRVPASTEEFVIALPAIEQALPAAVLDGESPGSLRAAIAEVYRLATNLRDRIALDSWRVVRHIEAQLRRAPLQRDAVDLSDVLALLNPLMIDLAAFSGLMNESMTRSLGWRLLDLGRRIDRALHTVYLLQTMLRELSPHTEAPLLDAVLEVLDSGMTYRSRYLGNLHLASVVDLVLTDEINPRSVAFQLVTIVEHVEALPRERPQATRDLDQRLALAALHRVRLTDVTQLGTRGDDHVRDGLRQLLARLATQLPELSNAISQRYLIHAGLEQHLRELPLGVFADELFRGGA